MFSFKDEDLDEARYIVSRIKLPSNFGVDDDLDMSDLEMQLEDVVNGDYFVSCGVSKAVIIVDYLPFVIKIPFNGHWYANWIDEYESEDDTYNKYFCEFYQANELFPTDYCYDEMIKTTFIQENGFGCFVPKMMLLSNVCGYNVYVQEKVIPSNDNCKDIKPSIGSLEKAKEKKYWDIDWAATAIDLYGFDFFNKFMDWVYINCKDMMLDLHRGNYGYNLDGCPVFLDISGFRD